MLHDSARGTIPEHRAVAPRVNHSLQLSAGEECGVMVESGVTPMATGDGARRHSVSKVLSQLSCEIGILFGAPVRIPPDSKSVPKLLMIVI